MIIVPPNLRRKRSPDPTIPTIPPFSLVSAIYSINDSLVTLTFNRAINIDDTDTHAFKVYDGVYVDQILDGATYGPYESNGIIIYFDQIEAYSGTGCTMNVTAGNGIKDAITGAAWGGVSGYELTIG